MQIVLALNHAVDEKELAAEIEDITEKILNVRFPIQITIPKMDERAAEPMMDLSGVIHMDIEIEEND